MSVHLAPAGGPDDLIPADWTAEERRELSQLVHEFAGRLDREAELGTGKRKVKERAARFRAIARQIHDFGSRDAE
jgi:hypothetical protein